MQATEEEMGDKRTTLPLRFAPTFLAAALATMLLAGCGRQTLEPAPPGRILIENDETSLNERVIYFEDEEIEIDTTESSALRVFESSKKKFKLKLRAKIKSPKLNKDKLEASHVTVNGDFAYMSYFTYGDKYGGGVDVMDISNFKKPKLKSQAIFTDTDVSIVVEDNGVLYLGEATDSDHNSGFATPAALEKILLDDHILTRTSKRLDLASFSANDIFLLDDAIYVTSGTTGGRLTIVSSDAFTITKEIAIEGAKAVGVSSDYVVVLEGTGTALHLFSRTNHEPQSTISLGCGNTSQGKAEIDIVNDRVYVSAWDCGVIAVDLDTKTIAGTISLKSGMECHGVSVNDDLLFMANGTGGLWVYRIRGATFKFLGKAKLKGTTNFVTAQGNNLFVASGPEGLRLVEVIQK